jgi:hypothetical protein
LTIDNPAGPTLRDNAGVEWTEHLDHERFFFPPQSKLPRAIMRPISFPNRRFSLHFYWVSHGLLLLRSGITEKNATRVDLLFSDVLWLSIPVWMNGLLIEQAEVAKALPHLPSSLHTEAAERRAYRLIVEDTHHFVVCGDVRTAEDQLAYFEPSALIPGLSMPQTL